MLRQLFRQPLVTTTISVLVAGLLAGSAWAESVGYLAGVTGTVEVQPSGSTAWTAGATDADLEAGDTIRTALDSTAKVILNDDTVLSIGEDTEIQVESLVAGSTVASAGEPSVLRLLRGRVRTRVGEAYGATTKLELHTPTAVVGVKGTDFETHLLQALRQMAKLVTEICTWNGTIWSRSSEPTKPKTEDITPGFCRAVQEGESPGDAYQIPADYQSVGTGPSSGVTASTGLLREGGGSILVTSLILDTPDVGAGPDGLDDPDLGGVDDDIIDPAQAAGLQGDDDEVFGPLNQPPEADMMMPPDEGPSSPPGCSAGDPTCDPPNGCAGDPTCDP